MVEVGDGSMGSPPTIEHLPTTENADGSMLVHLSDLENPDVTLSASVKCVAGYCKRKNKELRVKLLSIYFKFIALLSQMGFNTIEPAESTESYIVLREGKSSHIAQIASDVTLTQRENTTSSSNPYNLISNQSPGGVALAVQTSRETACEQGPEFQHSSQAFLSVPATGMGNDNQAAQLQDSFAEPEIPVQTKKRPHSTNKSDGHPKRTRASNYEDNEKSLLLQFRLEYLRDPANARRPHKWLEWVTEKMKTSGCNRHSDSLRGLWDNLKRARDALRESSPKGTSYWSLTMEQKKTIKEKKKFFPLTFEVEWCNNMEEIEKMDPVSAVETETQRDRQEGLFSQSLASTMTGLANFAGASSSVQHPRQANAQGSGEDLQPVDLRGVGPLPSYTRDLSFLRGWTKEDNQEIFVTKQKQLAVQREDVQLTVSASKKPMESSSSDSLRLWNVPAPKDYQLEMADGHQAGCNALENEEQLHE